MKKAPFILMAVLVLLSATFAVVQAGFFKPQQDDHRFIDYAARAENIALFYQNKNGKRYSTLENLASQQIQQGRPLAFATNGGMFTPSYSPVGLYIENGQQVTPLDTSAGSGNFYLKPNAVFYITHKNKAVITITENFKGDNVKYATQSGPMLLIDGAVHPAFNQHSANLNIRNGVGLLENGDVLFSISAQPVNFYDFAQHFKEMGCKNALYLDGFVSRVYYPEKNLTDSTSPFGVMIGVLK